MNKINYAPDGELIFAGKTLESESLEMVGSSPWFGSAVKYSLQDEVRNQILPGVAQVVKSLSSFMSFLMIPIGKLYEKGFVPADRWTKLHRPGSGVG